MRGMREYVPASRPREFNAAIGRWLGFAALFFILLPGPCPADIVPGQDVFLASGATGPLTLSWKPILPNSLQVKVDGAPQVLGLDYTADCAAGTITFTHAPAAGSAVTAGYSYDTAAAQPAGTPLALPPWTLEHSGSSSLDLSAAYAQSSSAGSLQMGLGQKWTGSSGLFFQTQAFYKPLNSNAASCGGFSDQTALDIAAGASAGHWAKLTFGYGRAGVQAGGISGTSVPAPGQQTETANAALTLSKKFSATLGYQQADAISPGDRGVSTQDTLAVAAAPNGALHIDTQVAVTQSSCAPQSVATSVSVQDQPAKTIKLTAGADETDPGGTQPASQKTDISASDSLTKQLSIQASDTESSAGATAADAQAASAAWNPNTRVQIDANLTNTQTQASSDQAAGVTFSDKLAQFLSLDAGYDDRSASASDTNAIDHLDTSTVGVTLTPARRLSLTDTFANNPTDAPVERGAIENAVGLSSSIGSLTISGSYRILDPRDPLAEPWTSAYGINASLGLWRGLKFTGGITDAQTGGLSATDSRTYCMGIAQSLSDRLNLAVNAQMTQQEDPGTAIPQTTACQANANIGLKF